VGGRWMDGYGAMVEWYWQGKTEVLGEKHYTAWVVDGWMSNGGMVLTGKTEVLEEKHYTVGGRWMNEYGAMVEWYWQGKTAVPGEKDIIVLLCPPQSPHGLAWHQAHACTVTGWWWIASAHGLTPCGLDMAFISHMNIIFTQTNQWLIHMEIMVALCKNHTKHINRPCGGNIRRHYH